MKLEKKTLLTVGSAAAVMSACICQGVKQIRKYKKEEEKYYSYFLLLTIWVKARAEGNCLEEYFRKRGIKNIGIYGMAELGQTLYKELTNSDINVLYGIDQNPGALVFHDFPVYSMADEIPEADLIVVTPFVYFHDIYRELKKKVNIPVVSLREIVYGIYQE